MKILTVFGLTCLAATGALAQRTGGGPHGTGRYQVAGSTVRPSGVRTGGYFGTYGYRGYGRGLYDGGYWPGLWDYGYGYGYAPEYQPASGMTAAYAPSAAYPPPNAYPVMAEVVHPVIHEYRQPEDYGLPQEHARHSSVYLIALQNKEIHAALAYWVEGGTLHYLDTDHKEKQAPLDAVDRDFSAQLNRERNVPFHIE